MLRSAFTKGGKSDFSFQVDSMTVTVILIMPVQGLVEDLSCFFGLLKNIFYNIDPETNEYVSKYALLNDIPSPVDLSDYITMETAANTYVPLSEFYTVNEDGTRLDNYVNCFTEIEKQLEDENEINMPFIIIKRLKFIFPKGKFALP